MVYVQKGHANAAYRLACLHLGRVDSSPRDTALLSRIDRAIQQGPSTGTEDVAEAVRHAATHGDCFALVTLAWRPAFHP